MCGEGSRLDTGAKLRIDGRHPMIQDDIRTLLDAPPEGTEAPTIDDIEHTLTAGYARALTLEAERWRLERKIAKVAAKLGDKPPELEHTELTRLGQRLSEADGD